MNVTITIDSEACVGYGECVAEDDQAVELDSQGCARVLLGELEEHRARKLCDACPTAAIRIAT